MGLLAEILVQAIVNAIAGPQTYKKHASNCRATTPHCEDCGHCLTKYVNRMDFDRPGPLYCFECFRRRNGLAPYKRRRG